MVNETEEKFEIMRHDLVPHHEIMTDEEKERLLKDYEIQIDQLPKILNTDPVSLYVGAKPGQILKITRKSHTAREAVAYRLVVESSK